jgi:arylsulfatase A-like enzyme
MLPLLPKFDDWNDLPTYAKSLARSHAHRKFHQGRFSDHEAIVNKGGDLEWKRTVGAYLSCVHYVDAQIGLLLEQFRRNPRRRPTMLILTSDHGWHLGEKKHWCKGALWRNTTRVPFIVVAPGLARAGTISDQPVSLVDVYPTLCEMANINPPPHLEGRSICGLLRDPELKRDFAFSSYGPRNTAVQTENLRYIRYEDQSEELYDHRSDPHEWDNLADRRDYAAIKKKLTSAAMRFEEHPTN